MPLFCIIINYNHYYYKTNTEKNQLFLAFKSDFQDYRHFDSTDGPLSPTPVNHIFLFNLPDRIYNKYHLIPDFY